jgi:hypothetical protein
VSNWFPGPASGIAVTRGFLCRIMVTVCMCRAAVLEWVSTTWTLFLCIQECENRDALHSTHTHTNLHAHWLRLGRLILIYVLCMCIL